MTSRAEGRILFLGIRHDKDVIGFVLCLRTPSHSFNGSETKIQGCFSRVPLIQTDAGVGPLAQSSMTSGYPPKRLDIRPKTG